MKKISDVVKVNMIDPVRQIWEQFAPEPQKEALQEVADMLARDLGESPEAWRGAVVFGQQVAQVVQAAKENNMGDEFMSFIMSFIAVVSMRPEVQAAAQMEGRDG